MLISDKLCCEIKREVPESVWDVLFHTGDEEETKGKCVNMRLQCVAEGCNWESQDLNEGLAEKTLVMHLQLAHQVAPVQQQGGGQDRVGAAAAGSLQPCQLGRDKTRRYQILSD